VQLHGGLASVMDGTTPVPTSIDNMIQQAMNKLMPSLSIIAYYGANPPDGWQICNGDILYYAKTNNLNEVLNGSNNKIHTPDLRGRTIIGTNKTAIQSESLSVRNIGDKGGTESHTLTVEQIPSHSHNLDFSDIGCSGGACGRGPFGNVGNNIASNTGGSYKLPQALSNIIVKNTGGGQPHPNMQPFLVLNYIIKQPTLPA
jgi:microcystin-dependent protein